MPFPVLDRRMDTFTCSRFSIYKDCNIGSYPSSSLSQLPCCHLHLHSLHLCPKYSHKFVLAGFVCLCTGFQNLDAAIIIIIIIIYRFLERHILKALWRFTILKINKKLQKTIKSLSKKKGLKAPFECV